MMKNPGRKQPEVVGRFVDKSLRYNPWYIPKQISIFPDAVSGFDAEIMPAADGRGWGSILDRRPWAAVVQVEICMEGLKPFP